MKTHALAHTFKAGSWQSIVRTRLQCSSIFVFYSV